MYILPEFRGTPLLPRYSFVSTDFGSGCASRLEPFIKEMSNETNYLSLFIWFFTVPVDLKGQC